ncbi:fimbrillin family protein [Butyricimonas sp. Marseille-P3923]|uniref:fimbrillin family protein n=1 Tax=Butyricimonas sp. Marseille-P3923 TaxID=1987504 RepID=UPI000C081C77|nr:fimbrillin family protein [Butyricimonas sp. Marseille-P3923]
MKLFGFILLASVLLSCVRNVSEESVNGREIRFRSNIQDLKSGSLSRVDGFSEGNKIFLYIAKRESADVVAVPASEDLCKMNYGQEGDLTFADGGEHYYPDGRIDVYGYYWEKEHSEPQELARMNVSVETDQSNGLDKSDFLYVKAAEGYAKDAEPIKLEFEHLFSKIVLNITTETPAIIDLTQLENVKLHDVVTIGILNLGTGEVENGEAKDEIIMPKSNNSSVIILPQEIEDNKKLFSFQVVGIEEPFEVEVPANNFEQGKEYTYNVKVNKYPGMGPVEMQFSVSVKDWYSEEPYEIVIEKGEEVEVLLTEVAVGVNISKADLYLSSGEVKRELKAIAVVDNKMKFVFPRLEEGGSLRLEKAIFYVANGEAFEYYFKDKELKGNNNDEVALPAPKVGDAWAGGTIFIVGEVTGYNETDNEFETNMEGIKAYRGRIVANESLGELEWCDFKSKGYTKSIGATDKNNGAINTDVVRTFIENQGEDMTKYPAFNACLNRGEGWYFPAMNEIKYIVSQLIILNPNIVKQGGDLIDDSTVYGSSTEQGEGTVSDYWRTDRFDAKDNAAIVRAVRAY